MKCNYEERLDPYHPVSGRLRLSATGPLLQIVKLPPVLKVQENFHFLVHGWFTLSTPDLKSSPTVFLKGAGYSDLVSGLSPVGFPRWLSGKEPTCHPGDMGSILVLGRSRGEGNDNSL